MALFRSEDTEATRQSLRGATLVIPAVSIGNVPQLAVDLLIHNNNFSKVATLNDDYLFPFAAPVDYYDTPADGISSALELYHDKKLNVALIQQRSPIIMNYEANFIEYLTTLINEIKFKKVIILDSNEFSVVIDQGIDFEKPIELYHNNEQSSLIEKFKSFNLSQSTKDNKESTHFTKFVNELMKNLDDIVVNALVMFVYEGDNLHDAHVLTNEASSLLDIKHKNWKEPKSWSGVYGDRPIPVGLEEGIYG